MEVINNLLNLKDYKIIQRTDGFSFSLDSVLLANFATINKRVNNIIDLGCGNAPIPIILSTRTTAKIIGVDIQEISCDLAYRSVVLNKLESQITIINDDFKGIYHKLGHDAFDLVVCNPPYFKQAMHGKINDSELKKIARHETFANLDDVLYNAKVLLRNNGYFAMVHRPERLIEIFEKMRKHNIEPKRIRFVYPKQNRDANLVLIEGRRNGREGLKIEQPLYTHLEDGSYSEVVMKMFEGEKDGNSK